jgi:hypothetical protein
LVKANGLALFWCLVSERLPGIISASSKVVKCTKGSRPDLGHWLNYALVVGTTGAMLQTKKNNGARSPMNGLGELDINGYNNCQLPLHNISLFFFNWKAHDLDVNYGISNPQSKPT